MNRKHYPKVAEKFGCDSEPIEAGIGFYSFSIRLGLLRIKAKGGEAAGVKAVPSYVFAPCSCFNGRPKQVG